VTLALKEEERWKEAPWASPDFESGGISCDRLEKKKITKQQLASMQDSKKSGGGLNFVGDGGHPDIRGGGWGGEAGNLPEREEAALHASDSRKSCASRTHCAAKKTRR